MTSSIPSGGGGAERSPAEIAQVPVMLAHVDAEALCTWCNESWLECTRRAFAEEQGTGWLTAFDVEDRARIAESARDDSAFDLEVCLQVGGDRPRWLRLRSTPSRDGSGALTGHLVAGVDVSEWRDPERVLRFLTSIGDVLASSIELDTTLQRVANLVAPQLAELCTIAVVDEDGHIRRVAIAHEDAGIERLLVSLQMGAPIDPEGKSAIAQVIRSGTVLYRPIVDAAGPDEPSPSIDRLASDAPRSLVCVPLRVRATFVGAITLVSWARRLAPKDVELVNEVADRCAMAVDHAALYRRSQEARAQLALLSSLGDQLSATSELEQVVRTLVRRIVPALADVAVVALRQPDGTLRRADVCHAESDAEAAYRERFIGTAIHPDDPTPIARAVRHQRPLLIEDFRAELASATSHPKKRAAYAGAESLDVASVVAVPLLVADDAVGGLVLGYGVSGRRYRSSDLPLALDVGRRAALGIERARAFDYERRVAETLQRSMLPDALPEIAGVGFCARYLTGGRGDVGGDWYDVVELSKGRLGLAIGDVAGHGVRAAAVMGQLRNALRAFATDANDPASVMQRLNRFVFEHGPADMATLCYAIVDPQRRQLSWSLAGHPPPLVMRPGAQPYFAPARPAPPIGADPRSRFTVATLTLSPATTVLFYTDGLVERRGESLDVGLDRLVEHARFVPALLDDACDQILDRLLEGERPHDDVAVLLMRFVGVQRGPVRVRRRARAAELAPLRRIISAWLEAAGVPTSDIAVVAVAVSEAATNAIEHAYGPGEGWFEVEAEIEHSVLRMSVRDEGHWRPKARGGGGRGLGLIGQLMDGFEVRRTSAGTEILMERMLPRSDGKDT